MLSGNEINNLLDKYKSDSDVTLQELIDSGVIKELKGYVVKPGKVSDSIFGGKGSFFDKQSNRNVEFENPPLNSKDGKPLRLMVRTSRISTHDFNRGEIPFKDQILATNHNFMRRLVTSAIGSSQIEIPGLPDNSIVVAAEDLKQVGYENVLRAYNARSSTSTSLFQNYIKGVRSYCGHSLPENLFPNCRLPYVMDTPTTKSDLHDECITPEDLVKSGAVTAQQYQQICNGSLIAFGMISHFLQSRGLIAVDTKTEHGINSKGEIVSQDEIWTIDSSRFWLADDYNKQLELYLSGKLSELETYIKSTQSGIKESDYTFNGQVVITPRSYSKEFARGFSVGEDYYNEEQRNKISMRYIESIQYLLGQKFEPDLRTRESRIVSGLQTILDTLL